MTLQSHGSGCSGAIRTTVSLTGYRETPLLGDYAIPVWASASAPHGGNMQLHLGVDKFLVSGLLSGQFRKIISNKVCIAGNSSRSNVTQNKPNSTEEIQTHKTSKHVCMNFGNHTDRHCIQRAGAHQIASFRGQ